MANTVVVHGASGHLGRLIVHQLLARGLRADLIVTPVRKTDSKESQALAQLGVRVVIADLLQPATLEPAYNGAHTIIHVPTNSLSTVERVTSVENSLAAAREAKVERFVAISIGNGRADSVNRIAPIALHLEAATRFSGLNWLIIRMGLYAENQEMAYKYASQTGVLGQPARGSDRVPWITRADIAAGIAAATLNWELHGRVFDLEGSNALSFNEIALKIGEISGKKVSFKQLSEEEFAAPMVPHLGPAVASIVSKLVSSFNDAARAGEFHETNDLFELTGK